MYLALALAIPSAIVDLPPAGNTADGNLVWPDTWSARDDNVGGGRGCSGCVGTLYLSRTGRAGRWYDACMQRSSEAASTLASAVPFAARRLLGQTAALTGRAGKGKGTV